MLIYIYIINDITTTNAVTVIIIITITITCSLSLPLSSPGNHVNTKTLLFLSRFSLHLVQDAPVTMMMMMMIEADVQADGAALGVSL